MLSLPRHDSDVLHCRQHWTALGPAMEALSFDFYEAEGNMQPAEVALPVTAHSPGVCNAIVFWFSLHLDAETELSTSPYEDKVTKTTHAEPHQHPWALVACTRQCMHIANECGAESNIVHDRYAGGHH